MSRANRIKSPNQLPLRQRVTLSAMLIWTVLGAILISSGVAGYYALKVLYDNKLQDTWAILFLELEQQGNRLAYSVAQNYTKVTTAPPATHSKIADGVFQLNATDGTLVRVQGDFPNQMTTRQWGLGKPELPARHTVLQMAGKSYLAKIAKGQTLPVEGLTPDADYLLLYYVDVTNWIPRSRTSTLEMTSYLLTREDRLLYANDPSITAGNFEKRPLVQKFITSPLRQGQLEYDNVDGPEYGFFQEAPGTNIMIFVETSKRAALAVVREITLRFVFVLFLILAFTGVALQFPITSLVIAPMRELIRIAGEVGDGNFDVVPRRQGLGELNVLSTSFQEMAKSLIARDKRIQTLLLEQREKARLEDELAIAHSIQNNFLLNSPLPKDAGVEVAAQYTPAAEVAGDWYGYSFDPGMAQSVFAIADVSGHGVGSAMFTAIIAAAFEETRDSAARAGKLFPLDEFAVKLNHLIIRLGHGKMHATLLVASLVRGSGEISVLNAGHPSPMLVSPAEKNIGNEPVIGQSDILGMAPDFKPMVATVPFLKGMSLFMFTDGLIEGSPDHKIYSERRLGKATKLSLSQPLNQMVIRVYEDWKDHLKGQQALDDVCLLALRAVA